MEGTIDPKVNYAEELDGSGERWPILAKAHRAAQEVRQSLTDSLKIYLNEDVDVVVFGSLARGEWTSGSDVDWTLLIDGQSNPDHRKVTQNIRETIYQIEREGKTLKKPGTEGIFGSIAFSHDIVHHIGGQIDTNKNITQRVLLLLESVPIRNRDGGGEDGAFKRVTRNVISRYLHDDTNFSSSDHNSSRIPRFLLNDVVRYWRTMCVDFAYKEWEQANAKWALRNIKLRMSRKLLFVSSLFTVFSCYENTKLKPEVVDRETSLLKTQDHLMQFVHSTPIDIVIWTLIQIGLQDYAEVLLDHYNRFLEYLDDAETRTHLECLAAEEVYEDKRFLELRDLSRQFQSTLNDIFFREDTDLKQFTVEYGVF